jgi:hypothetical protein
MEGHFYSEVAPKGIEHEPYYDASLAFKMLLEIGCNPDIPDATPSPLQRPLDGLAVLPPGDISLPFVRLLLGTKPTLLRSHILSSPSPSPTARMPNKSSTMIISSFVLRWETPRCSVSSSKKPGSIPIAGSVQESS